MMVLCGDLKCGAEFCEGREGNGEIGVEVYLFNILLYFPLDKLIFSLYNNNNKHHKHKRRKQMNEIYYVRGRGGKLKELITIKIALLLGYKVKIIKPQDTIDKCYGRKAILQIDEFPLDKPSNSWYNKFNNQKGENKWEQIHQQILKN